MAYYPQRGRGHPTPPPGEPDPGGGSPSPVPPPWDEPSPIPEPTPTPRPTANRAIGPGFMGGAQMQAPGSSYPYSPTGGPSALPGSPAVPIWGKYMPIEQSLGPANQFNYYDAGNGLHYVYDHNWNYLYTAHASSLPAGPGGQPTGPGLFPNEPGGLVGGGGPTVIIGEPGGGGPGPGQLTLPGLYPGFPGFGGTPGNPFGGAGVGGGPGSGGGRAIPPDGPISTPGGSPWYTAGPYPGGNTNPSNPGYVAPGVGPQLNPQSWDQPGGKPVAKYL